MNRKILPVILFMILFSSTSFTQDQRYLNKLDSNRNNTRSNTASLAFNDIETSIAAGNMKDLAKLFAPQTYFSLSNGTSGYYSANQAYYVLEDFFKIYQLISFRLKNVYAGNENPYATGEYYYDLKGKRETAQVYIALKFSGNSWKITQITIN